TPDSVIVGFITSNLMNNTSHFYNNYVVVDDMTFTPGNGTFPNSNFENWFATTIVKPVGWSTINYIGPNASHPDSNHMSHKVFFNPPGDFAAEVSSVAFNQASLVLPAELTTR